MRSKTEPRRYALRALCLSEARPQPLLLSSTPPVCTRFARLDWGYEVFSLSEAGRVWQERRGWERPSAFRGEQLPRDIFLAKSQRSQRRSMNILQRLRTAFHDFCPLSAMFFVYSCTLQMSDMAHADIMGQLCLQNTDLSSISISNDAIIGKDGRKAMGKPLLNYFRHCSGQSTGSAPIFDGKAMWRLMLFSPPLEGDSLLLQNSFL